MATRIGRVRITCKAPPLPPPTREDPRFPRICGLLPSLADAEITVVGDDGTELALIAEAVEIRIGPGADVATATLRVVIDRVDIDALAKITLEPPQAKASRDEAALREIVEETLAGMTEKIAKMIASNPYGR